MVGLVVGGKYHIIQLIGEGGMGAVYDAIHAKTGRRVALKLIHEHLAASPGSRRRFERESRAAAAIDSLHVVQILDSGEDAASGMPFLVMEFLQGEDLRTLLRRGPIGERLAIAIALQMASGVKKAHEVDVVHRDLKPANVFLARGDDGQRVVKVLDFGIAKLVDGDGSATATGDLVGSPAYMSPEQLRAPSEVDAKTDVWGLGVVLYEMLSGRTPTAGVEAIGARAYAICHTPSPSLRTLAPHVSEELAAIVHRALEIEPARRFASVEDFAADLRGLSGAEISEEEIAAFLGGSVDEQAVVAAAERSRKHARTLRRRSHMWWLAAVGAGLVIAFGARPAQNEHPRGAERIEAPLAAASAIPVPLFDVAPASAAPPSPTVASSATNAKAPSVTSVSSVKRTPAAKRVSDTLEPRPATRLKSDGRDQF